MNDNTPLQPPNTFGDKDQRDPFIVNSLRIANALEIAAIHKSWREPFIINILRIACVLGIAAIAALFSASDIIDRIVFSVLYITLLLVTVIKTGYSVRAYTLLSLIYILGVYSILAWGPWIDGSVLFVLLVALSALLFDRYVDIVVLVTGILTLVVIALLQQWGGYQFRSLDISSATLENWGAYAIGFSTASIVLIAAIRQLKSEFGGAFEGMQNTLQSLKTERTQFEDQARERGNELEARAIQLRSSSFVSRNITEVTDTTNLMETATSLISEQFGYYHAGLYLLDERKRNAFLQAASSADGKQLIGQGFRIEPDRFNVFHRVIANNQPYIGSDADIPNFIRDPNFRFTRSRMALPLRVRNNVIGILDIHSDQRKYFNNQDAELMQTLADLVSISLDNARLLDETNNLIRQLESSTAAQTRETWRKFTSRHKPAYQYTPAGVRPIFASNRPENSGGLRIPLILHSQHIGNITLKRKGAAVTWSERERILVEKVADQVALAIENSRLVDETQKSALRDQVIANISARVRETLDVESVLRTAATELRRVFDLKEAEINIGALQTDTIFARKNTGVLRLK